MTVNKKRTPYQQEMDAVHLSKEKADETLNLMLRANHERVRSETGARRPVRRLVRYLAPVMAAAAALVILLVSGALRPAEQTAWRFSAVRAASLPAFGARGGDTPVDAADPAQAAALFPGWTVAAEPADPSLIASFPGERSAWTLEKNGIHLVAAVSEKAPALATALADAPAHGDAGVRLNRDPDTGTLSALWRSGELYIVLSARDMTEDAFARTVLEVASP